MNTLPPSVLTVDTLWFDTFGALLLIGISLMWLWFGYRAGDLHLLARWLRSWLPTTQKPPMPVKPIWMAPEFYERKALDRSNFAASHAATVTPIEQGRKRSA